MQVCGEKAIINAPAFLSIVLTLIAVPNSLLAKHWYTPSCSLTCGSSMTIVPTPGSCRMSMPDIVNGWSFFFHVYLCQQNSDQPAAVTDPYRRPRCSCVGRSRQSSFSRRHTVCSVLVTIGRSVGRWDETRPDEWCYCHQVDSISRKSPLGKSTSNYGGLHTEQTPCTAFLPVHQGNRLYQGQVHVTT